MGDACPLNDASVQLLIDQEVGGGQPYYNKFLSHPTVPGGSSGVTIGVGYDLGYEDDFATAWAMLPQNDFDALRGCLGLTKDDASGALDHVKAITIPWDAAFDVFQNSTIPKYYKLTLRTFPGMDKLTGNAQGALVSLVFNRGTSLDPADGRRKEMRDIVVAVSQKDLGRIAADIRAMKRLWIGTDIQTDMTERRNAEAELVLTADAA